MSGLEEATAAFQSSIGGAAPVETSDGKPEKLGHGGALIDDETAGGDDEDDNTDPNAQGGDEGDGSDDGEGDAEGDGQDGDDEVGEDEGDGADDEDAPSGEFDPETEVTITVDGKPQTVKLGEAVNGYIRTETFHQRLNELNEYRGVLQQETQTLVDQRKQSATMLEELQTYMEGLMPAEPDWNKMFAEDPAKARELQVNYEQYRQRLEGIKAKRAEVLAELRKDNQKRTTEYAQAEFGKFLTSNKITDQAMLTKELNSMRRTAMSAGFKEEEIATVYDSRMLTLLRKASKYDRIVASSKKANNGQNNGNGKPVTPGKRTLTPGVGNANKRTAPNGNGSAMKRLARTGSIDDATNVFANIINRS